MKLRLKRSVVNGVTESPINFDKLDVNHFKRYCASLKKKEKPMSKGTFGQIRSSLKDCARQFNFTLSKEFESGLEKFFEGLAKTLAAEKQKTGERMEEGKEAIDSSLFRWICQHFSISRQKEYIFGHLYILLMGADGSRISD